jgi:hypothetical protein
MRKVVTLFFVLFAVTVCQAQTGTWRAYLAYHDVTEIEKAGNMMYVLASNNLYSYNENDQSIQTYDKINSLSDTQIAHIKWCQAARRLLIVYTNYNIDLLKEDGTTVNIAAYYNKPMTEDKTVNSIYMDGRYAYLSTSFGILKLNMTEATISDTYNLGFNIDYSYANNGYLYAASSQRGLYRASMSANMLDPNNWSRVGEYTPQTTTLDPEQLEIVSNLQPGGPKYDYFYMMRFINNMLYSCGGLYHPLHETRRPGTIQLLNNDNWTICQDEIQPIIGHDYIDIDCIDVDPNNSDHLFAGGRTGLFEFLDGKFVKEYSTYNSELKSTFHPEDNRDYVIVNGLKFDDNGNLWMLQSLNSNNKLLVLTKEGNWIKKDFNAFGFIGDGKSMFFDSQNYLWFVNNHYMDPALYRYDINKDEVKAYMSFVNQDSRRLHVEEGVRCATEDLNGNIWIGTSVGPLLLEKSQFDEANPVFTQVKVPRNDGTHYADYLLDNVDIPCMAIDAGNRKWFGTKQNGVYLISDDNLSQLAHFTAENSPLLSNHIESIAINEQTGEVFFGTEKGLCSYMSGITHTNEEMTKDNVYAYPNPVKPDYTGLISVVGLSYDAEVKITTVSGKLVAEGHSNGGTFTWDGCDKSGKRVASGVYLVNTSTADGKKGTVCKIAIVR